MMSDPITPARRQQAIFEKLRQNGSVEFAWIEKSFGVSIMTAHRDALELERAGLARKIRGGLALPIHTEQVERCLICHRPVPERTRFTLSLPNGEVHSTCCPHCGLTQLSSQQTMVGAMAIDFLYGTTISAASAVYVIGSRVRLCCSPSLLSFEYPEDARSFQLGFGGEVMDLSMALRHLGMHIQISTEASTGQ